MSRTSNLALVLLMLAAVIANGAECKPIQPASPKAADDRPAQQQYAWTPLPIRGGGYMRYTVIDPRHPDVLYAACDVAGVFKSIDGGLHWQTMVEGLDQPHAFSIGSIALSPRNTEIVYAVTAAGLYRSDNGGRQWVLWHRGFNVDAGGGLPVGQRPARYLIAIDPENPDVLYLSTIKQGVQKSTDGGRTFRCVGLQGKNLSGIFLDPNDSRVLYVAAFKVQQDGPGGIFKTSDGGETWQGAREDLDVRAIAIHPTNKNIVYAACYWDGLYKSSDGGKTWVESNGSGDARLPARKVPIWYQKVRDAMLPYDSIFACVAIDPQHPDTVYVVTRGKPAVWRSDDAGQTWRALPAKRSDLDDSKWWAKHGMVGSVHLAIDPVHPNRLFLSDLFTVFRSDDRGEHWVPTPDGIENTFVQDFYFDPRNPDNIYLGMNDETLFISRDHGKTLDINTGIRRIRDGRINIGNTLIIDGSTTPNTLFLGTLMWIPQIFRGGVYKSTDDGANWLPINNGLPDARVYALAQHPVRKELLLAGIANHGFFRTVDSGRTWTACNQGIVSPETVYGKKPDMGAGREFGFRADIVFDSAHPDIVYATAADPVMICKSADAGETWTAANRGLPATRTYALRIRPDRPGTLLAACGPGGLFRTEDAGQHWEKVGDFTCHFLDLFADDPNLMVAGTRGSLKKSCDGGRTWIDVQLPTLLTWLSNARFDPTDSSVLFVGTFGNGGLIGRIAVSADRVASGPVKVEIRQRDGRFELLRGGEPYYVKGAVYWGSPEGKIPLRSVADCGGNSVRCGGRYIGEILDAAERLGLTAMVGLPTKKEAVDRFDYDNPVAVKQQFDQIERMVEQHKDHPALLIWDVGNELTVGYKNKKMWTAVNDMAAMIHRIDPNHPTTIVIGDGSINNGDIKEIIARCPEIDILGINCYKGIEAVPAKVREEGWQKPYMITEFGPSGAWQVPKTKWKVPIEETSTEKAARYLERYRDPILRDKDRCLGSYVFFWDQKQERTHTWYGMFLPGGQRTGAVDAMQYAWTGRWPANRAPIIEKLAIDGLQAIDSVSLEPGTVHTALVAAKDPDGDPLTYRWEILPEPTKFGYAGRGEVKPQPVPNAIQETNGAELRFLTPSVSSSYRVFVIITDGQGNAATANIPCHVAP